MNTLGDAMDSMRIASESNAVPILTDTDSDSDGIRVERFAKGSQRRLADDGEYELGRLLNAIGSHADEGTEGVLRWAARGLPSFRIARVRESLELFKPHNRARYAVGALKSEVVEGSAA